MSKRFQHPTPRSCDGMTCESLSIQSHLSKVVVKYLQVVERGLLSPRYILQIPNKINPLKGCLILQFFISTGFQTFHWLIHHIILEPQNTLLLNAKHWDTNICWCNKWTSPRTGTMKYIILCTMSDYCCRCRKYIRKCVALPVTPSQMSQECFRKFTT